MTTNEDKSAMSTNEDKSAMSTNEDKSAMSTNVSGQNRTVFGTVAPHDPLCPRPLCDYGEPDGDCTGYEDCEHDCRCSLIDAARADEREQAAQRVADLYAAKPGCERPDCPDFTEAIAAARGETQ